MTFDPVLIETLQDLWGWLVTVVGGLGALVGWWWRRKKARETTYEYMLRTMEELQLKVVQLGVEKIKSSAEIARKNELLRELKVKCPGCYEKVINMLNNEQA